MTNNIISYKWELGKMAITQTGLGISENSIFLRNFVGALIGCIDRYYSIPCYWEYQEPSTFIPIQRIFLIRSEFECTRMS